MHYIQFVYFCIYCFAFRTPLLHLQHVRVRAQMIQSLFYVFLPSLQRYTVQYIIDLLSLSILIITVCIYTSLPALHMYIHVCILFCIQETTTIPMPRSDDSRAPVSLPPNWTDVSFGAPGLRLCHVAYQELPGTTPLVVTHSLIVKQDCSWDLNVHDHTVDSSKVPSLQSFPDKLSSKYVMLLLNQVATSTHALAIQSRSIRCLQKRRSMDSSFLPIKKLLPI